MYHQQILFQLLRPPVLIQNHDREIVAFLTWRDRSCCSRTLHSDSKHGLCTKVFGLVFDRGPFCCRSRSLLLNSILRRRLWGLTLGVMSGVANFVPPADHVYTDS